MGAISMGLIMLAVGMSLRVESTRTNMGETV
jgi:hypothetical protein